MNEQSIVWADFNEIDDHGQVHSLVRYLRGPVPVLGASVMTQDGDGNLCPGTVTVVTDRLISVAIDLKDFVPVPFPEQSTQEHLEIKR